MLKYSVPALLLVVLFSGLAICDQPCGSTYLGGIIPPGNYVGVGDSCKQAKADLKTDAGMTNPICEGCPPEELGCIATTVIPDESNWDVGNCYFDSVLQKWVVVATCSGSTQWDKVCSSCN
jgi:hypothetical protein